MKKRGRPTGKTPPRSIGKPVRGIPVPPRKTRGHPVLGSHRNPGRYAELIAIIASSELTPSKLADSLHNERRGYFALSEPALVRRIRLIKSQA